MARPAVNTSATLFRGQFATHISFDTYGLIRYIRISASGNESYQDFLRRADKIVKGAVW
jgi:hypothetical protein